MLDKDGETLKARHVTLGDSNFDYVEVVNGLRPGEKVVISEMPAGAQELRVKSQE